MTLNKFISTKPTELRLGQYFYNTYMSRLSNVDSLHEASNELYNTNDNKRAVELITNVMNDYNWSELW